VKRDCAELAYCEGIAISTKHFTFSKLPVFSTKVTERFKINPDPIGKMAALRGTNSRQPARPLAIRRKPGAREVSGSEAARVHHPARGRGRVAARGERAARIGEITRRSATRPQVDCRGGATNPISSPPRAKSRSGGGSLIRTVGASTDRGSAHNAPRICEDFLRILGALTSPPV